MKKLMILVIAVLSVSSGVAHADIDHPIRDPATGIMVATRLNPPPPPPPAPVMPTLWTTESANGKCVGLEFALNYFNPGWDVNRMMGIAYRESRCDPFASNSCCSGLFQIHRSWIDNVGMCGVFSRNDLYDGWKNVCAASVVFREQGMGAWSTA